MRKSFLLILIISIQICSCNNRVSKQKIVEAVPSQSTKTDTAIFPKPNPQEKNESDGWDTTENMKQNLLDGRAYKFVIDGRTFRLRNDENDDSILLEYKQHNKWIKNTSLVIRDQFELDFDCNYDGHFDIYSQAQGWNFVNFYLPGKRLFSDQYQQPGDAEYLLDSVNNIYANYREPYHICNNYISQLLDYKKTTPTIHYLLEGETYRVDGECIMDSIETMKLYRYNQLKDSLILLRTIKPKDPKKFEYAEFWRDNYKKLMKL